jgi:hypothetical protein
MVFKSSLASSLLNQTKRIRLQRRVFIEEWNRKSDAKLEYPGYLLHVTFCIKFYKSNFINFVNR